MTPSPAPLGDDWSLWARAVFANIDIYRDQRPGWPYKGVKWAYLKKNGVVTTVGAATQVWLADTMRKCSKKAQKS